MKPKDKTSNKAIIMAQLKDDLHRSQTNEKQLMDQNTEMKKQLSSLTKVEMSLKKEQVEVTKLQNKVDEYKSLITRTRAELNKVKNLFRDEQTQRVREKTVSDQRIIELEKEFVEMKNQYNAEKKLREQKDKELEKLQNINEDYKKLLSQEKALRSEVKQMTGFKTFSARTIEELKKNLRSTEEECRNAKHELSKLKEKEILYRDQEFEFSICKNTLDNCQKQNQKMDQELEKCLKNADANEREINWLRKENAKLTKKGECDSVAIKALEQRMLTLGQTIKSLKDESDTKEKEKEMLQRVIQNLKDQLTTHKELKRKLHEQEDKNTVLISNTDGEIVKLRNLVDGLEHKYKHQQLVYRTVLAEKQLISQSLAEAEEELDLNNKKLENMNEKVKDMTFDIDQKKSELLSINQKLNSAMCQIKKLETKLVELKRSETSFRDSAEKEKLQADKNLAQAEEDNKQLSKKLTHANEQALQQQKKINILQHENEALAQTIKERDEQITSLRKQNHEIQDNYDLQFKYLMKKVESCDATRHPKFLDVSTQPLRKPPQQPEKEQLQLQQTLVEQEDEIASLNDKLANEPDDSALKLALCQLDVRELQEELKASKAISTTYSTHNKKLTEENKSLTDEARKLKLACRRKSKETCLPPLTEKATSRTVKPKDKFEDLSRCPRLPPISTKSPVPPAESKKAPPSPFCEISCRGTQMRPCNNTSH